MEERPQHYGMEMLASGRLAHLTFLFRDAYQHGGNSVPRWYLLPRAEDQEQAQLKCGTLTDQHEKPRPVMNIDSCLGEGGRQGQSAIIDNVDPVIDVACETIGRHL